MSDRIDDIKEYPKGYRLQLRDENSWWLTGSQDILSWLNRLAAILELKRTVPDGMPKLIFSRAGDMDHMRDRLNNGAIRGTDNKWSCHDRKLIRIWNSNNANDTFCEIKSDGTNVIEYVSMLISLQLIYKKSMSAGGLPFHAALIELDGKGLLLAASGDTGKSTCCRRLPSRWTALCDDETLVVLDKQGEYWAHPFPTWSEYLNTGSGNTWNVQYSVPLCGIFFLEQAEVDESIAIGKGQAAFFITEAVTQICRKFWKSSDIKSQIRYRSRIFDNACKMVETVPAFRLRCSLHGRFWEEIEKAPGW